MGHSRAAISDSVGKTLVLRITGGRGCGAEMHDTHGGVDKSAVNETPGYVDMTIRRGCAEVPENKGFTRDGKA